MNDRQRAKHDSNLAKGELHVDVSGSESRRRQPDIAIVGESWKRGLPPVWTPEPEMMPLEVAEPILLEIEERPKRWVEIRTAQGELVTVIEVLSPANKAQNREDYIDRRGGYVAGGVNVVEIDLVRQGRRAVDVDEDLYHLRFKELGEHYVVCASRRVAPGRREVYPCPLREKLPVIRIPLRASDPDVPLDIRVS